MKKELAALDDATLQRSIEAWEQAVVVSRVRAHIDVADHIRNQYVGELVRRKQAAKAAERA